MSVFTTEPAGHAPDERLFESIYEEHFELLVNVAIQKFRVPDSEAETLAHEVFLTYLRKSETVRELRPWLVGAICHASRHYWRLNHRLCPADSDRELDRVDPSSMRILESLPAQLAARQALECLTPHCQEVLRLRYFEGCSINEVAERLGIKAKYAQKLINKCLRRAEKAYGGVKGKPS